MRPINPTTEQERQQPHLVVAYGDGVVSVIAKTGDEVEGRITLSDDEMAYLVRFWDATPDSVPDDKPLLVSDVKATLDAEDAGQ